MDQNRNTDIVTRLATLYPIRNDIVFGFLDPWAVHTNKFPAMLDAIVNEGLGLAAVRFKKMTEGDVENIYRKNRPISLTMSWHLPEKVCSMGISVGFIAYSNGENAYEKLKAVKGNSDPLLNTDGMLRSDFRAPNKSLSLIHTSDDWKSSLQESLVFFGEEEIAELCSKNTAALDILSTLSRDCIPLQRPSEIVNEPCPTKLLVKMRLRACEYLNDRESPQRSLRTLWSRYLEKEFDELSILEEYKLYQKLVDTEKEMGLKNFKLEDIGSNQIFKRWYVHSRYDKTYIDAINILHNISNYPFIDTDWFCRRFNLTTDRWEQLLFQTTLFHFDSALDSLD